MNRMSRQGKSNSYPFFLLFFASFSGRKGMTCLYFCTLFHDPFVWYFPFHEASIQGKRGMNCFLFCVYVSFRSVFHWLYDLYSVSFPDSCKIQKKNRTEIEEVRFGRDENLDTNADSCRWFQGKNNRTETIQRWGKAINLIAPTPFLDVRHLFNCLSNKWVRIRKGRHFPFSTSSFMFVSILSSKWLQHFFSCIKPFLLFLLFLTLRKSLLTNITRKCRHGTMRDGKVLSVISITSLGLFLLLFLSSSLFSRSVSYWKNMKLVQVRGMVVKIFLERSLGMQAVLFLSLSTFLLPSHRVLIFRGRDAKVRNLIPPSGRKTLNWQVWFVHGWFLYDTFGRWAEGSRRWLLSSPVSTYLPIPVLQSFLCSPLHVKWFGINEQVIPWGVDLGEISC